MILCKNAEHYCWMMIINNTVFSSRRHSMQIIIYLFVSLSLYLNFIKRNTYKQPTAMRSSILHLPPFSRTLVHIMAYCPSQYWPRSISPYRILCHNELLKRDTLLVYAFCDYEIHPNLYTLCYKPYYVDPTLHTLHSTSYILHCLPYTVHPTNCL